MKIKVLLTLCSALTAFFFNSCSGNKNEIVAEFGDQHILLNDFRIAYLDVIKKPDIFDSPELREKFLDELIASRVLAKEAEKQGYFNDEKIQYKVEAYRNKTLREAHFDAVIRPMFSISEEDIQEAYIFSQEERKVSQLFVQTKARADSIYTLLQKGQSFAELAGDLFADSALAASGGDLGWINFDAFEYDLAMTAFRAPVDMFSAPVKSQFGYHIIKVTDYKKKPLITRQEYETYKHKTKIRLELMLGEKYASEYITEMLKEAEIVPEPKTATIVRSKLKNVFRRKPDQFNLMNEMQLTDDEVELVEQNLWDLRHEKLAEINGKVYTVGEFLGALNYVPYHILYSSFKTAMNYAFRDFLIEQETKKLGLEKSPEVQNKSNLYKEFLLQLALRRHIVFAVEVADNEVKDFFENNKATFKGADIEQVEEIIKNKLMRDKKAAAVPEYLTKLLNSDTIRKHTEIIHQYYDSVINRK